MVHLESLPSQNERLALITGSTGELGVQIARQMLTKGARVMLACRNQEKGELVRANLLAEHPRAEIEVIHLDLSSLASIDEFAGELRSRPTPIDLLFANAGVMAVRRRETEDGFETQFGVNHLGHFVLVARLLPLLTALPDSRLVTTTSMAAWAGRIDLEDPMGRSRYNRWTAYNQSKLANILFAFGLDRRLRTSGSSTSAVSAHPGYVYGNLQQQAANDSGSGIEAFVYRQVAPLFGQDAFQGALPLVHAASSTESQGGDLWGPHRRTKGRPVEVKPPRAALDVDLQDRLWKLSEELTGVKYDFAERLG